MKYDSRSSTDVAARKNGNGSTWWLAFSGMVLVGEVALAVVVLTTAPSESSPPGMRVAFVAAVVGLAGIPLLLLAATGVGGFLSAPDRRHGPDEEDVLADIAAMTQDWVWTADAQMRLTFSNARVTELLGYLPEDLYGRPMSSLLPDAHVWIARANLAKALRRRTGWCDLQYDWLHRDGHVVTLEGSARAVLDKSGAVSGFRGARHLVTSTTTLQRETLAVRQRILDVLDTGSVEIALQPIVRFADGRMEGAEALARFRDGRSPALWFAEARDTGQNLALELLTLRAALDLLPTLHPTAYLAVNASPESIAGPALQNLLLHTNVALGRIVLEITEHVAIDDYDTLAAHLAPLREAGLRVAIDDTGAGYASLNHVLRLRPDIVKIDRSLVNRISGDGARRSLVAALVGLASDLEATVTAEGVESLAEVATLSSLGVDAAQGYLLGRPTTDPGYWLKWRTRSWGLPQIVQPDAERTVTS